MNNDPARQAFDRLYGHLLLSGQDAAWHVFKSGWEAREQPARRKVPAIIQILGHCPECGAKE